MKFLRRVSSGVKGRIGMKRAVTFGQDAGDTYSTPNAPNQSNPAFFERK